MKTLIYDVIVEGFSFHGTYELEPAEEGTETLPAYNAFCTVLTVCLKGFAKDIYSIIDPAIVQEIEHVLEGEAS